MAQAAAHPPFLRSLGRLVRLPPNLVFGLRFALATCTAIWIGHLPGLITNKSQWILITVLVVMQPAAGGSLMKGILRSVGTLVAAGVAILLFGLFAQEPPLLLAGLFLSQAVGAYGFSGTRSQYAWFVFAFTTAIILGDAITGTEQVETIAFQRASMVGIGILIVFLFDALVGRSSPERVLRQALAQRATRLADELRREIAAPLDRPEEEDAAARSEPSPLAGNLGLVAAAHRELGTSRTRVEALRHVALLLEAMASRRRMLRQAVAARLEALQDPADVARALAEVGRKVGSALERAAEALVAERAPTPFAADLERAVLALQDRRTAADPHAPDEAALRLRIAALRDLARLLRTFEGLLRDAVSDARQSGASRASTPRARTRFGLDPLRVQIALRSGIAVCAAILTNIALGWELNTLVAPIAFMIASAPTRGGATQSSLPLIGVILIGWAVADLGIVFFATEVGRFPLALLFPFTVACVFSYVGLSRPQLGALGSIGSLLALLPVMSGPAAPMDVYGSYSTTCYFALALAIGWCATRLFWPATASALFRERAAALLELCRRTYVAPTTAADRAEGRQQAEELLAAYTGQVTQLGSFHAQARHEPVEGELDDARRSELLGLTQDLFDGALAAPGAEPEAALGDSGTDSRTATDLAAALAHLHAALLASMQRAAEELRADGVVARSELAEASDALEELLATAREREDARETLDPREPDAFLARLDSLRQLALRQLAIERWLGSRSTA